MRAEQGPDIGFVVLSPQLGRILRWFIEHQPSRVPALFGSIMREAERELAIAPDVTQQALTRAVLSGTGIAGGKERMRDFFAVALPPQK